MATSLFDAVTPRPDVLSGELNDAAFAASLEEVVAGTGADAYLYGTMLVTLGAAWPAVSEASGPAIGARRSKLQRWFWCASFMGRYENAANFNTEQDVPELSSWLRGTVPPPAVVAEFDFDPARWRQVTVRQRALYRTKMALAMRKSPLDFHEAKPLNKPVIDGQRVDDHHIFPRNHLHGKGLGDAVDSVLNHTLIDRKTNIRISDNAPSVYLEQMAGELRATLQEILASHHLPTETDGPLWEDRFDEFLRWRQERLAEQLVPATSSDGVTAPSP